MQKRLADGCHLTRDPVALITAAGFDVLETASLYGRGPKPWMYFTEVQVRKPELCAEARQHGRVEVEAWPPIASHDVRGYSSVG